MSHEVERYPRRWTRLWLRQLWCRFTGHNYEVWDIDRDDEPDGDAMIGLVCEWCGAGSAAFWRGGVENIADLRASVKELAEGKLNPLSNGLPLITRAFDHPEWFHPELFRATSTEHEADCGMRDTPQYDCDCRAGRAMYSASRTV